VRGAHYYTASTLQDHNDIAYKYCIAPTAAANAPWTNGAHSYVITIAYGDNQESAIQIAFGYNYNKFGFRRKNANNWSSWVIII